jgi:hypothetical protein
VNKDKDILVSNRDFIYFPESNKENNNIEITDKLRIDKTLF